MKKYPNLTAFWCSAGLSIAIFLLTWWITAISIYANIWATTLAYYGLTWWCLTKFMSSSGVKTSAVVGGLVFGRLAFDIAIRVPDFMGAVASLILTFACLAGILTAVVCYKERRTYAYVLSVVIIILLNTVVSYTWLEAAPFR